jgi:hypothetical protein
VEIVPVPAWSEWYLAPYVSEPFLGKIAKNLLNLNIGGDNANAPIPVSDDDPCILLSEFSDWVGTGKYL